MLFKNENILLITNSCSCIPSSGPDIFLLKNSLNERPVSIAVCPCGGTPKHELATLATQLSEAFK